MTWANHPVSLGLGKKKAWEVVKFCRMISQPEGRPLGQVPEDKDTRAVGTEPVARGMCCFLASPASPGLEWEAVDGSRPFPSLPLLGSISHL